MYRYINKMKSLKELAADKVKWHKIDGADVGPLVKDECCRRDVSHFFSNSTGKEIDKSLLACKNGHGECVEYYFARDVKKKLNFQQMAQIATKYDRLEIVHLVYKMMPVHTIVNVVLKSSAKYGKPSILKWALNQKPLDYYTLNDAAALAALYGNVLCFEMCLDFRPSLSVASAIKGNNPDILLKTLERVKADARDFALAAKMGSVRAMESMLKYGNAWDETTPATASRWGNLACLRFAHENGCKWTSTTLFTTHQDCIDYATKHKCGNDEKCECVFSKRKFLESGNFFKNTVDADTIEMVDSDDDISDIVSDDEFTNIGKRAALFEMLVKSAILPRAVEDAFDSIKPASNILTIMSFLKGIVSTDLGDVKKSSNKIWARTIDKVVDREGPAFEEEHKVLLFDMTDLVSLSWSRDAFVIKLKKDPYNQRVFVDFDNRVCWFPEDDLIYVHDNANDTNFHGTIERSKFIPNPEIRDGLIVFASFIFQRPLEEVCGIFCFGDYKPQASPPKKAKKCKRMEDLVSHPESDDSDDSDSNYSLESPSFQTLFVMFLRKNNIVVMQSILDSSENRNLWRAPGQYGVDYFVLKNSTLYDTRSRMSSPVQDLLRVVNKVPKKLLFVLFLFSLPVKELNSVFEERKANVKSNAVDISKIVAVRATDYCRHAIL